MFDIGPLELLTIALVALIVFGPHRLPDIARKAGKYVREIRRAASELTAGLEREVKDLQEPLESLKADLTQPLSDVKESLDDTAKGIQDPLREVTDTFRKPVSSGGPEAAEEVPTARWVGDEPEVGVSPDDAWKGLDDPVPAGLEDGAATAPAADQAGAEGPEDGPVAQAAEATKDDRSRGPAPGTEDEGVAADGDPESDPA